MARFLPIDRDSEYLFPPSVQDWLPETHLARYIANVIESLDLTGIERAYAARGSDAYHPASLMSLLIYGYATGVFSSRRIKLATFDSVAFRYLACNRHPDHDTLATFRRRFGDQLQALFVQVLQIAQANRLSQFGTVSLDGTKIHANASRHSALSYAHAEKLEAQLKQEVQELLALADTGYYSEHNVGVCLEAGMEPLITTGREDHHPHWQERFTEPAPLAADANAVDTMKHALKTRAGKKRYALRKQTVEPVFGIIKSVMKFRQFMRRGLVNVGNEWTLVCLAWNLKRLAVLHPQSVQRT